MSKILKNTTGTIIDLNVLGIDIPALGEIEINAQDYISLATVDSVLELTPLINAGEVVVNDGVSDLSSTEGINYVSFPNFANSVRLDSSSFVSKDVRSALEELTVTPNEFGIFAIWAEENGGLANNSLEFSFGNGSTGNIGVTIPVNARLFAVSYQAETSGTNTEIAVTQNNTNVATTGLQSNNSGFVELPAPVQYIAGDVVNFRTVTGGGAVDVRPCAWFKVPISTLMNLTLDELTDVQVPTQTTGEVLQYNGSFWVNSQLDKTDVGLGNVDNTSDLNKPISTATQTALNLKYNNSNPQGYETPAQLNVRDTNNRARSNHTGTQLSSTINDFAETVRSTILTGLSFANTTLVTASDSILVAIGKLQTQLNSVVFGRDADSTTRIATVTVTGNSFVTYDELPFTVTESTGTNTYRLNADFFWSHGSTANDILVRVLLDGVEVKELRIEPKDSREDQRIQNNLLHYAENLSVGNHTFTLQLRPERSNRESRVYESVIEVWRTK